MLYNLKNLIINSCLTYDYVFLYLKLDVPGIPSSVVIEDEGSRHLKIKWKDSKDSNAPITRYIIAYKPSETQIDKQGS